MIHFFKNLWKRLKENREKRLFPEKEFIIEITEEKVSCIRPDGRIEEVAWEELTKIEIQTTDQGPFVEDVFWILHGNDRGCVIPQGATNNEALLSRLQEIPGFNNEILIEAMGCTDNAGFLIWEK